MKNQNKTQTSTNNDLSQYEGEDKVISSYEMKALLDDQKQPEVHFFSGIPSLDKYTGGFRGGQLIIISGYTKHGKTLLAQTLCHNFLKQQIYSLWFSYELMPKEFLEKFPELPLFYLPQKMKANNLAWVEERISESLLKYRTKAIFLDHLHYLTNLSQLRNPSLRIGEITRHLKRIAVENNLVIFLIAHTTKLKMGDNRVPSAENIRDSSFIAQDSDTVFMIWRLKN